MVGRTNRHGMEGLQKKINKLIKIIREVEKATSVEINVDIDKTVDIHGENEEHFYTLFIFNKEEVLVLQKEVSFETAYNYLKGILVGYEFAIEKQLHTICNN